MQGISNDILHSAQTFNYWYIYLRLFLVFVKYVVGKSSEPWRQKTYLQKCSPNEDSDQPAHSRRLIKSSLSAFWITEDAKIFHCENTPTQIYRKLHLKKLKKFRKETLVLFYISAQNIDCRYSLEPPRRGGSNEYPQSMFLSRNKKNNAYPCKPQIYYIKKGV